MAGCLLILALDHALDDPPFDALQFTSDEVENVLQDLDVNKDSGYDDIPPSRGNIICNSESVLNCWFIEECTVT
jgi:hypothetical protein